MNKKICFLFFGIYFGFALSRVGASEYDLIYGMFTGTDLTLAWVMIAAIITGHIGMRLLKMHSGKTRKNEPIDLSIKPLKPTSFLGGALFGIGWGISGACPGTVLAQLGEGKILGFFTAAGMVIGTYLYALLKERYSDL